jgi:hypothetical protein
VNDGYHPFNPGYARSPPTIQKHRLTRVLPVERKVLAHEDSQLCAASKYEKQACELRDQRILRAIFLLII